VQQRRLVQPVGVLLGLVPGLLRLMLLLLSLQVLLVPAALRLMLLLLNLQVLFVPVALRLMLLLPALWSSLRRTRRTPTHSPPRKWKYCLASNPFKKVSAVGQSAWQRKGDSEQMNRL